MVAFVLEEEKWSEFLWQGLLREEGNTPRRGTEPVGTNLQWFQRRCAAGDDRGSLPL